MMVKKLLQGFIKKNYKKHVVEEVELTNRNWKSNQRGKVINYMLNGKAR